MSYQKLFASNTTEEDTYPANVYRERSGKAEEIHVSGIYPTGQMYAETPNSQTVYGTEGAYTIEYYRSSQGICSYGYKPAHDNFCIPVKQKTFGMYDSDVHRDVIRSARNNAT